MATSENFIKFVCEQINSNFAVCYRKMFGEYMVYVNEKPVLLVCDSTVFVKILPETEKIMAECEKGFPYDGAKEHFILDIENAELSNEIIKVLERITPIPKRKKKQK